MLPIKAYLTNSENIKNNLKKRGFNVETIDTIIDLSQKRNQLLQKLEQEQFLRNQLVAKFSKTKPEGIVKSQFLRKMTEKKSLIKELNQKYQEVNDKLTPLLLIVPNLLHKDTPIGFDQKDNVVFKTYLNNRKVDYPVIAHDQIIKKHKLVDVSRAVKMAGTRFVIYKGKGAKLIRAITSFLLDQNETKGYYELTTPVLVNSQAMIGTGQLPKFASDLFKVNNRDLWLIPTGEVSLTNYYQNEILNLETPISLMGFSNCFRSEAGSAGKDTKGVIRLHQFNKVEIVKITKEDQKIEAYQSMLEDVRDLLTKLELPFREVILCSGDLGFAAEYTRDFEVWLPSENRYLEVSSVSLFSDFQARRLKIRYFKNNQTKYATTMNGSALAIDRIFTTIVENFQTKSGEIRIPKVLEKYLKFKII